MADLNSLRRNLERLESNGNFRLQTQAVNMLISEVQDYVRTIAEEEAAVKQIPELERLARIKPENTEDEREVQEAKQALRIAENLKRNISNKKAALRQLGTQVQTLLTEIKKVV